MINLTLNISNQYSYSDLISNTLILKTGRRYTLPNSSACTGCSTVALQIRGWSSCWVKRGFLTALMSVQYATWGKFHSCQMWLKSIENYITSIRCTQDHKTAHASQCMHVNRRRLNNPTWRHQDAPLPLPPSLLATSRWQRWTSASCKRWWTPTLFTPHNVAQEQLLPSSRYTFSWSGSFTGRPLSLCLVLTGMWTKRPTRGSIAGDGF